MIHLILGGARSGKSSYAENLAKQYNDNVIYVATATADDKEMETRISYHKKSRPPEWRLIEEPFFLSSIVNQNKDEKDVLLIDCLTLWLSNWLCKKVDPHQSDWDAECNSFLSVLKESTNTIFIVSNEVGSGIVPMGELSREFSDKAGWLNQKVASVADNVTLVVAGLPLVLKK
ncbi:MAG: bifunctional adenosylcobinamide kinase/adenosylcobinamide-phosphate guanylyltransferase [Kangiella sp.]|nr:MAG: bifunctional adenosylcobinamide kinase/adenosylcobinamide-phosphate guanylyltransferase [Kangiella sp.]